MVKEELCEKVPEIRRVSDGVVTVVVTLGGCSEVDLWVCSTKRKKFGRKTVFL